MTLSHRQLEDIGERFLREDMRCVRVMKDPAGLPEIPDVFGLAPNGDTWVLDAKCSVEDYHADRLKSFRKIPQNGLGTFRAYITEPGLLEPYHASEFGWGLYEVTAGVVVMRQEPKRFHQQNHGGEKLLLNGALSNTEIAGGVSADAARTSSRRHLLPEESAELSRLVLAAPGGLLLKEAIYQVTGLTDRAHSAETARTLIAKAIKFGEVPGVSAIGSPSKLVPSEVRQAG